VFIPLFIINVWEGLGFPSTAPLTNYLSDSARTYLHPLRRSAKILRYYLIPVCKGLFSHHNLTPSSENFELLPGRSLTSAPGYRLSGFHVTGISRAVYSPDKRNKIRYRHAFLPEGDSVVAYSLIPYIINIYLFYEMSTLFFTFFHFFSKFIAIFLKHSTANFSSIRNASFSQGRST